MASDPALREELLAMAAADGTLRARLVAEGTLFDGYHPEMAALHRRHAARLAEIVGSRGWPGRNLVSHDGAEAAWLVAQHAIGDPPVMRRCLPLLEAAAARGEAPAWQPAYLLDRIRTLEGRPPEDPAAVDTRRAAVGLGPLGDGVAAEGEPPPADPEARRRAVDAWARDAGWR